MAKRRRAQRMEPTAADRRPPSGVGSWAAIVAACVGTAVAYTPWGLVPATSVPMAMLGLAGALIVGGFVVHAATSTSVRDACAWRVGGAVSVVVVVAMLSTLLSPERFSALFGMEGSSEGLIQLATFAGLVVASAFLATGLRAKLTVAAPLYVVVTAVVFGTQMSRGMPPTGLAPNTTFMAQALILFLPFVLAPAFDENGRALSIRGSWWRWGLGAVVLVLLAVGEATNALVAVLVLLAWLGFRAYARREAVDGVRGLPRWLWLAGAGAVVAAVAIGQRATHGGVWADFFRYRSLYWRAGLRLAQGSPVVGVGPDTMRSLAAPIAPAAMLERSAAGVRSGFAQLSNDPHNILVWVAMYFGALGIAAFAWFGYEVVRNWRTQSRAGAGTNWAAAATVMLAISLVSAPITIETLALAGLVLGASLRPERLVRPEGVARAARLAALGAAGVGVTASVLTLLLGATYLALGTASTGVRAGDASAATRAATAWSLDPYLHYTASLRLAAASGGVTADRSDLGEIQRAVALAPRDPVYALEYARTQASYGIDAARTRAAYERAIALFPNSLEANLAYARFLAHEGAAQQALRFALAGLRIAPEEPEANTVAADVYASLGQTARAGALRARAARLQAARGAGP